MHALYERRCTCIPAGRKLCKDLVKRRMGRRATWQHAVLLGVPRGGGRGPWPSPDGSPGRTWASNPASRRPLGVLDLVLATTSPASLDLMRESVRGGADYGEGWPAASGERRWWGRLAGGELGEQRRPHLGEEESSGAGGERRVSGERDGGWGERDGGWDHVTTGRQITWAPYTRDA